MVNLNDYELYWNSIKERIPTIGKIIPIRTDPDMADEIQSLSSADLPALFVILPSSNGKIGDYDNYQEENISVVFVMDKVDPQRKKSYQVQKETQPVIEAIKTLIREDAMNFHPLMRDLDAASLSTIPESGFYTDFAGWSIGFQFRTS